MRHHLAALACLTACAVQAQDNPLAEDTPEANEAERAAKRAWPIPEKWERPAVDWTMVEDTPILDPAPLSESSKQALARVKVPALLPNDPELLASTMLLGDETWYTAAAETGPIGVFIRGTLMARPMAWTDEELKHMKPPDEPWISRTHDIITVSFTAYNVAYNLEIECPQGEPRCENDDYAWQLYESLALAGSPS